MNQETASLKLSAWMSLFMAIMGVVFALWTASGAILMDGLFSLVNLIASIVTIRVAKLVTSKPDARFHFGYAQFEPFLNVGKSISVLVLCAFALITAVDSILHGGRQLEPGPALVYALVALVGSLVIARLQRRAAQKLNSPILAVEAQSWLIDGLLSGVVAVAFAVAIGLERTSRSTWVPYIDPLLVVLLILVILWVPIRIARNGFRELLAYAPEPTEQVEVRDRVAQALEGLPIAEWHVRMHQVGRYFYVMTQVVLKPDFRLSRVQELDRYRRKISESLQDLHPSVVTDTVFTEDPRWIEY